MSIAFTSAQAAKFQLTRHPRGQSGIEFLCGLPVLLIFVLCFVDLSVMFAAVSYNNRVCHDACRAAANGAPEALSPGGPVSRARQTIKSSQTNRTIVIEPQCTVSEKIFRFPDKDLGGPVQGNITVTTTTATVFPPFLLKGICGNEGLHFSSTATAPITFVAQTVPQRTQANLGANDSWVVTIICNPVAGYLKHEGSKIRDLTRVSVFYANVNESAGKGSDKPVHYEDLLYTGEQIVGCNRLCALGVKLNSTGVIRIISASRSAELVDGYGSGNAVGRLFMDLLQSRCTVRQVVVPIGSYADVVKGLCLSGFHQDADQDPSLPIKAILCVASEPEKITEKIYY